MKNDIKNAIKLPILSLILSLIFFLLFVFIEQFDFLGGFYFFGPGLFFGVFLGLYFNFFLNINISYSAFNKFLVISSFSWIIPLYLTYILTFWITQFLMFVLMATEDYVLPLAWVLGIFLGGMLGGFIFGYGLIKYWFPLVFNNKKLYFNVLLFFVFLSGALSVLGYLIGAMSLTMDNFALSPLLFGIWFFGMSFLIGFNIDKFLVKK